MHSQTWVAHTLERVAAFEGAAQGVSVLGATPVDCDVSLQQALLGGGAGAAGGLPTVGMLVAADNRRGGAGGSAGGPASQRSRGRGRPRACGAGQQAGASWRRSWRSS